MILKIRNYRFGVIHYSVGALLIIFSFIILHRNIDHGTAGSDRSLTKHASAHHEERIPREKSFADPPNRNDRNLSKSIDALLTATPFSVNGFSSIAAEKYGFGQKTVELLNSYVLQAHVSAAKLISSNLIAVEADKSRPDTVVLYEYKADLNTALSLKNDLIAKVNSATGQSFDSEIDTMLGGSRSFLFCGSTNFKFHILASEEDGMPVYIMEYTCDTVDGTNIFSNYRCALSSFTNSTLIDFDLPSLKK